MGSGGQTELLGGRSAAGSSTASGGKTVGAGGASGGASGGATSVATGGTLGHGGTGGVSSGGSATGGATMTSIDGACTRATGVAVLTVRLTAAGQGQRVNYQNYDNSGASYSLAGATLKIVACAPGAIGGSLHVFFSTPSRVDSPATDVALSTLKVGFNTISVPVPNAAGGFDPSTLMVTRIELESGSALGTSWQVPATVVYIDSISTSDGRFTDTFDTGTTALMLSGGRQVGGSTLTWLSEYGTLAGTGGTSSTGQAGQGGVAGDASEAGNTGTLDVGGRSSAGNAGSGSGT